MLVHGTDIFAAMQEDPNTIVYSDTQYKCSLRRGILQGRASGSERDTADTDTSAHTDGVAEDGRGNVEAGAHSRTAENTIETFVMSQRCVRVRVTEREHVRLDMTTRMRSEAICVSRALC